MSSEVTFESPWLVGNTHRRQRGSGHSVVLITAKNSRHRAGRRSRGSEDEGAAKLCRRGVYVSERLKPHRGWEGLPLKNGVQSRGQNRTRESRPSGIAGGLAELWGVRDGAMEISTLMGYPIPFFA
jgi:hypothetical protein